MPSAFDSVSRVTQLSLGAETLIDWTTANIFTNTLTANKTYTWQNAKQGDTITLRVINSGSSSITLTFPTAKWANLGTDNVLAANTTAILTFFFDGTNYHAASVTDLV